MKTQPKYLSSLLVISLALHLSMAGDPDYHQYWRNRHKSCPMGAKRLSRLDPLLDTLFPGLFVSLKQLKNLLFNDQAWRVNTSMSVLVLDEMETTTAEITTPEGGGTRANFGCCAIVSQVIKPLTVKQDGITFNVVHLEKNDQLITTSSCSNPLSRCNTSGRCMNKKGYNWVLVYDLTVNYYPPVRFIPLQVSIGCECL